MLILALELPNVGKELVVTSFGAVLGFLATITVEQFKRRREPQKRLIWSATTRSADVALDDEMRERLSISFDDTRVGDLTSVEFALRNSGNTVIRDHQIRFEFPADSQVLAADVHPAPEREMAAQRRPDLEEGPREAVFRVGHFERSRTVAFRVVASGPGSARWQTISHNESGDVEYREGSEARATSDADHVPQFLALLLLLLTLPPVFRFAAGQVDFDLGDTLSSVIYGCCLLGMFPHVMPACRTIRDALVAAGLAKSKTVPRFEINGRDNAIVYGEGLRTVTINPDGRSVPPPRQFESRTAAGDDRAPGGGL